MEEGKNAARPGQARQKSDGTHFLRTSLARRKVFSVMYGTLRSELSLP